jgi:hypothetical protein
MDPETDRSVKYVMMQFALNEESNRDMIKSSLAIGTRRTSNGISHMK